MHESEGISNEEKVLIALASAMGAGCRTCAERLHSMAESLGVATAEVERAIGDGLRVRQSATETMREKAAALVGRAPSWAAAACEAKETRIGRLRMLAAAAAANSSPDALGHIQAAKAAGATEAQVSVAMGIARAVRAKAQGFSDAEIGEFRPAEVTCEGVRSGAAPTAASPCAQNTPACCAPGDVA